MKTLGDRAIAALVRHELAAAELTRIKKAIVAELEKCPITMVAYESYGKPDHDKLFDGTRVRHHLHEALTATVSDYSDSGAYRPERRLDAEEITDQLTGWDEDSEGACPHCLAAWRLIQDRSKARAEAGIAKRLIRALGKVALKVAP